MDNSFAIRRHELSDAEWESVRPLLPESSRGRKRLDDRRILNGIVWKFRTGTTWRDVPDRYGPWATLHTRFRRWAADGTFERMLRAAQAKADAAGDIDWLVLVDSTIVRAHQHAAGAKKGGLRAPALGRSRGGLNSKIHLACDGPGPSAPCPPPPRPYPSSAAPAEPPSRPRKTPSSCAGGARRSGSRSRPFARSARRAVPSPWSSPPRPVQPRPCSGYGV
ncbi:IS5 family transposase [Streptomyces sp. NPDC059534]|uniref:IS5 family transposase n=1 Tax=Streptomyces sp. NPDC059534 TaxID=3346859 RepID=UPI00368E87C2